jgi:Tfp pilus assembly protein PilX
LINDFNKKYLGKSMKQQQSGSVLAISLVLLTAITLIAVMNMQRAGLQTKIVGALQHREGDYNRVANENTLVIREMQDGRNQSLSDAMNSPSNTSTVLSLASQDPHARINTTILHIEPTLNPGKAVTSSLRNDNSRGKNGAGIQRFKITTRSNPTSGASSAQTIGSTVLSPE